MFKSSQVLEKFSITNFFLVRPVLFFTSLLRGRLRHASRSGAAWLRPIVSHSYPSAAPPRFCSILTR
jgi:hypothetical protein